MLSYATQVEALRRLSNGNSSSPPRRSSDLLEKNHEGEMLWPQTCDCLAHPNHRSGPWPLPYVSVLLGVYDVGQRRISRARVSSCCGERACSIAPASC